MKNLQKKQTQSKVEEETVDNSQYIQFYKVDEPPQPLTIINPSYPEEARRLGLEGKVKLLIYIDAKG